MTFNSAFSTTTTKRQKLIPIFSAFQEDVIGVDPTVFRRYFRDEAEEVRHFFC